MTHLEIVSSWFASGGRLEAVDPSYEARPGQIAMAQAVALALDQTGVLVVEAGTGVGKTYAYLLPTLLSGQRVLISTATRALQDQLCGRDIPRLLQLLGIQRRVMALKGRSSYLCQQRLGQARISGHFLERDQLQQLAAVERWAQVTRHGDLAELPELEDHSPLLPLITSTRDNCLGRRCAAWDICHVNQARRQALSAEVVVTNHHLFFADQQLRESGVAELLPEVQAVVFDEAHRLNDIAVQFLGRQWSTRSMGRFASRVLDEGLRLARGFQPWPELVSLLERGVREVEGLARQALSPRREGRLAWQEQGPERVPPAAWSSALRTLRGVLGRIREALERTQEMSPELRRLTQQAAELDDALSGFESGGVGERVRWLELGGGLRLLEAPLTMASALLEMLAAPATGHRRTWVFTSATLGLDQSLAWFMGLSGLAGQASVLRVPSPFDYPRQAALHVPRALGDAQDPDHAATVARWAAGPVRRLGGRTLILATSLRALGQMASVLRLELAGSGIELLVQGEGSRRRLLQRFRAGGDGRAPCVLLASGAFWEGVDIPGAALQLLIIDKLPFPPPDDPLVMARSRLLGPDAGGGFQAFVLPETAMALRQGAGRLIRSVHDHGLLVVADDRLLTRSYGPFLLRALPPMPLLPDQAAFEQALGRLAGLTRASTTDLPF